ncbi:unnamed protein product [Cylindrotheca closterium]|uniref:Peptidase S54 rhomboid domain-containing protein n=1 Tax=Cylindrotheca closterium TaxID=2856 RepID=A0AAD2FIR9_9STRA|nr:unnamed protein product [Cylindrotheca closterium]
MKTLFFLIFLIRRASAFTQPSKQKIFIRQSPSSSFSTQDSNIQIRCPKYASTRLDGKRWLPEWDGDDIRFLSRLRRRIGRYDISISTSRTKNALITVHWLFFLYQTVTAVNVIRKGHRSYWPKHALSIIADVLLGKSVGGPYKKDFLYSNGLGNRQPHRFLTSGFVHHSIIHFLVDMIAIRNQPSWLAMGLGGPLYLTTYLSSIVAGNVAQQWYIKNPFDRTISMGANGAIGGIYGLMYVQLMKMETSRGMFRVIKGMGLVFLIGTLIENVNPVSQVGGFVGGAFVGILCAPGYKKSYSLTRKNSVEVDPLSREYRQEVGYGILPTRGGWVPLPIYWAVVAAAIFLADDKYRMIPVKILKGLWNPGSL